MLLSRLEAASANTSMEEFHDLVATALNTCGLQPVDLARKLGTSIPMVLRWREGASAPLPPMRPAVFNALKELLKDKSV